MKVGRCSYCWGRGSRWQSESVPLKISHMTVSQAIAFTTLDRFAFSPRLDITALRRFSEPPSLDSDAHA